MTNSPQASWKAYEEGAFYAARDIILRGVWVCLCVCVREMSIKAVWGVELFKEGTRRTGKTEGPYHKAS